MRRFFRRCGRCIALEWRLFSRQREPMLSPFFFTIVLIVMLQVGFPTPQQHVHKAMTTMIWLVTLFGGVMRLTRCHDPENEGGVLSVLRMIPNMAVPYFVGKVSINFIILLLLNLVATLLVALFMNLGDALQYLSQIGLPFLLGLIGLAVVGTTFSSMMPSHGRRELVLPLIAYPILMPLIIGLVQCFEYNPMGSVVELRWAWIVLLVGFDVLMLLLSLFVFEHIFESR